MSFEAMVGDLETVVDELGLERFALLGMSQGAAISIAYAVRHPERVTALVLCGGYARGHAHRGRTPEQQRDAELLLELIRVGWGTPNPKFRRVFATMFLPDATPEQYAAFDELQRVSATPEIAYRLRSMFDGIDVTALCARRPRADARDARPGRRRRSVRGGASPRRADPAARASCRSRGPATSSCRAALRGVRSSTRSVRSWRRRPPAVDRPRAGPIDWRRPGIPPSTP